MTWNQELVIYSTQLSSKLVAHLPDIPNEAQKVTDIDQEIEERLLRLKFFNQSWLPNKNFNSPQPIAAIDMGDGEFDELHSEIKI